MGFRFILERLIFFCGVFIGFHVFAQMPDEKFCNLPSKVKREIVINYFRDIPGSDIFLLSYSPFDMYSTEVLRAFPFSGFLGLHRFRLLASLKCEHQISRVYLYPGEWELHRLESAGKELSFLNDHQETRTYRPNLYSAKFGICLSLARKTNIVKSDYIRRDAFYSSELREDSEKMSALEFMEKHQLYDHFSNAVFQVSGYSVFSTEYPIPAFPVGDLEAVNHVQRETILQKHNASRPIGLDRFGTIVFSPDEVSELTYLALLLEDADTAEARYKDRLARYPEYLRPVDGGHLRTELGRMLLEQMSLPPRPAQATAVDALPAPEEPMRTPPPSPDSSTDRP